MTTVLRALRLDGVLERVGDDRLQDYDAVLELGDDGASTWKALDAGASGVGPAGVGASMQELGGVRTDGGAEGPCPLK